MTSQVYNMKGAGHKDRANPPFCFYCWSTLRSIVPRTSARLYSVDYQHWGDFAELKEITVSINRFVLLPFLLLCASSISFSISTGPFHLISTPPLWMRLSEGSPKRRHSLRGSLKYVLIHSNFQRVP